MIVTTRTTIEPRGQLIRPMIFLSQTRKPNISFNISTSLTKVRKLFNAIKDALNGYQTSCINCWKPIKAHITEHEALPREALKLQQQPQWLGVVETYIKPS